MATSRVSFKIKSNRIPAVIKQLQNNAHKVVDDSAVEIQTRASQLAPVDTGSLRESIYRNNGTESDYNERVARARSLNKDLVVLDNIDPEFAISITGVTSDAYVVVVGVAASHGIHQEFGTRFIRSHPFLTPATLGEESNFQTAMTHIADGV